MAREAIPDGNRPSASRSGVWFPGTERPAMEKRERVPDGDDAVEDDDALVLRAQKGDAEAFDRLMLRHQAAIAKQMRRYAPAVEVIDDLTQTVFINAYRGLSGYRPHAPFLYWLRTIAVRVGYEHWRRESRRPQCLSYHGKEELLEYSGNEPDGDASEEYGRMMALMERLLPMERQILILIHVDGLSMREAAACMGWNTAMTKMRAYRARIKLRRLMQSHPDYAG